MRAFSLVMLLLVIGCDSEARHEDVSGEPRSAAAIVARYEVVGAVDAYGIRRGLRDLNPAPRHRWISEFERQAQAQQTGGSFLQAGSAPIPLEYTSVREQQSSHAHC